MQSITAWLGSGFEKALPFDSRAHSWARRVESLESLPGPYHPFLNSLRAEQQQPLPYMVLTPTFRGIGRRSEPERLVCLVDDAVHVAQQREGRLASALFPVNGECQVERGVLLLHSWITMHGPGEGRSGQTCTLRFNTVTDHLMAPFIDALRAAPIDGAAADLNSERQRFDHLAQRHYKFFSHGRNCVRPGDRVLQVLMQPEVRGDVFRLFGHAISRRIAPAHLTILTESELILIRDDESQRWIQGSAPGAIWNYNPRRLIDEASIAASPTGWVTLQVRSSVGPALEAIFGDSMRAELQGVVDVLMRSKAHE